MARFYDWARRDSQHWPDQELTKLMAGAEVIEASNVADYIFHNSAKTEWDIVRDFPNIAPPFQKFFIECKAPQTYLSETGVVPWPDHIPKQWGTLFIASEISQLSDFDRAQLPASETPDARWILQAIIFAENNEGNVIPQFSWYLPVKANGTQPEDTDERDRRAHITIIENPGDHVKWTPAVMGQPNTGVVTLDETSVKNVTVRAVDGLSKVTGLSDKLAQASSEEFPVQADAQRELQGRGKTRASFMVMSLNADLRYMSPAQGVTFTNREEDYWLQFLPTMLLTISFMHCKNVKVASTKPHPKLHKRSIKKHKVGLCTYHTLEIQPMRKVLATEGRAGESGITKALHICRGHFSTYNEDKPLFGRVTGTFWIPAHLRGSIDEGMRDKAYKVKEPRREDSKAG